MNKRLIIIISAAILLIVSGLVVGELIQYKSVSFRIAEPTVSVDVYNKTGDSLDPASSPKIASATNNQSVSLKNGEYFYVPSGNNIDNSAVAFSVNGNTTVDVISPYSRDYLSVIAQQESSAVKAAMLEKYPDVMAKFNYDSITAYGRGQYIGIILTPVDMDQHNPSGYYRAVLQKNGESWSVIGRPEIVLTKHNTPGITIDILTAINSIGLS